jgi:1-acyl-sn-glycerol-3-phosphate acyltransferase
MIIFRVDNLFDYSKFRISSPHQIQEPNHRLIALTRPMHLAIFSLLFWGFMVVTSILAFPIALLIKLLTQFFDKRLIVLHSFTCYWASIYSWLNPFWSVRITGKEHIQKGEVYVYVCNHQSLADILVLFRLFVHFKWVSKIENFRIPLVGWNMYLNRYIALVRSSIKSQAKMMKDCQKSLDGGSSILIFPEGTRTRTGKLRPFKSGAFQLASRSESPIVPIVLNGSSNALPKAGFILQGKHKIDIHIMKPIQPEQFKELDVKQLTKNVRSIIDIELQKMQSPHPAG